MLSRKISQGEMYEKLANEESDSWSADAIICNPKIMEEKLHHSLALRVTICQDSLMRLVSHVLAMLSFQISIFYDQGVGRVVYGATPPRNYVNVLLWTVKGATFKMLIPDLPSKTLYGEVVRTIVNFIVVFPNLIPSLTITSMSITPMGRETSLENPTSGVLDGLNRLCF
ncbi:hypothetical protein Tco_1080001 [Tanacetum coccineum]|uniref:Uncharacterized protein n=1 Tax=Tanacetum coccineum TaxID=301880 RepID=A0ABQ5HTG9_9ASTR